MSPLTLSHTHTFSLSLSLLLHTQLQAHTHTHTHTFSLSLTHTLSLLLAHNYTHQNTHTSTHPHHTHTHTCLCVCVCVCCVGVCVCVCMLVIVCAARERGRERKCVCVRRCLSVSGLTNPFYAHHLLTPPPTHTHPHTLTRSQRSRSSWISLIPPSRQPPTHTTGLSHSLSQVLQLALLATWQLAPPLCPSLSHLWATRRRSRLIVHCDWTCSVCYYWCTWISFWHNSWWLHFLVKSYCRPVGDGAAGAAVAPPVFRWAYDFARGQG